MDALQQNLSTTMDDNDISRSFIAEGYTYENGLFETSYVIPGPEGDVRLKETVDFTAIVASREPAPALLRLLALACSLSYYKATLSTEITVNFAITEFEESFFKALVSNGLGEYAYKNALPDKLEPKICVHALMTDPAVPNRTWDPAARPLIAVGGGKDSVVTIELLKKAGCDPLLFSVNGYDPIDRTVSASGCDYVRVKRTLAPELTALNAQGAPNGHVPVTAVNSLIGLVAADIMVIGPVVMSNEASASVGNLNWHGREINHQWSKGLEFEDLLRATLEKSGLEPDRYFSLLRSMREIDIARRFARMPQYFTEFTSCNRVFRLDPTTRRGSWCGECPKCLFVYLILAPFISRDRLVAIFGHDLLDVSNNEGLYKEILGLSGHKPFECVGEYDEAVEALRLIADKRVWQGSRLVPILFAAAAHMRPAIPVNRPDRVPVVYRKIIDAAV